MPAATETFSESGKPFFALEKMGIVSALVMYFSISGEMPFDSFPKTINPEDERSAVKIFSPFMSVP